jgi:hypothetical protein
MHASLFEGGVHDVSAEGFGDGIIGQLSWGACRRGLLRLSVEQQQGCENGND